MLDTNPKVLKMWRTDPVAANRGEDQRVSLLTVPVELDTEERLTVVLLQRPRRCQHELCTPSQVGRPDAVFTHPQTVDTLKRVSALLGLPLALPPALPPRNIGCVCGCVRALSIGAALHADSIILQTQQ